MFPGPLAGIDTTPKEGEKEGPIHKLVRETREESDKTIPEGQEAKAFYHLSTPKKITVMAGGICMNLLLGIIFLTISFAGIGQKVPTTTIEEPYQCISSSNACVSSDPASPAFQIGLHAGDKIISVNNQPITKWTDIAEAMPAIEPADGSVETAEIPITYEKATGEITTTSFAPYFQTSSGKSTGKLGISPTFIREKLGPGELFDAYGQYIGGTVKGILSLPAGIVTSVKSIFTHESRGDNALISIVGLGQVAVSGVNHSQDFLDQVYILLSLLGSLNIALFVFNLIPLLPLDGGHVINALYEGIKRTVYRIRKKPRPAPADLARIQPLGIFMFGVLLALGIIMVLVDIVNPLV
jgi:membrane-associated protease RseP (regulator of RpoE activity)